MTSDKKQNFLYGLSLIFVIIVFFPNSFTSEITHYEYLISLGILFLYFRSNKSTEKAICTKSQNSSLVSIVCKLIPMIILIVPPPSILGVFDYRYRPIFILILALAILFSKAKGESCKSFSLLSRVGFIFLCLSILISSPLIPFDLVAKSLIRFFICSNIILILILLYNSEISIEKKYPKNRRWILILPHLILSISLLSATLLLAALLYKPQ